MRSGMSRPASIRWDGRPNTGSRSRSCTTPQRAAAPSACSSGASSSAIPRRLPGHSGVSRGPGLASQFGTLTGLEGLGSAGRAEVTPYLVTKNVTDAASTDFGRSQDVSVGGDLRYRLASNLLVNATVNPDFGQVEADPSELNLSAFETFFTERRPFFVEGKGLFTFTVNCVVVVDCSTGEGLFYSRRIGRSPQLGDIYGDRSSPEATKILGAAKITGRMPGGFSIGVLDAVTDRISGPGATTLEPTSNYAVVRGKQDLNNGDATIGFMLTGVNRSLDATSAPYLHRSAYSGGVDARYRFNGRYEVSGSLDLSRVAGDPAAIARTQRDPVHLYQRPDGPLRVRLDPDLAERRRTRRSGSRRSAASGSTSRPLTSGARPASRSTTSAFFSRPTSSSGRAGPRWSSTSPTGSSSSSGGTSTIGNTGPVPGLPTERAFNTNVHVQFTNRWWLHMGGTIGQLGATYCDRCARGGPAIRQDPYLSPWIEIDGDDRRPLVPILRANYTRSDQGRSEEIEVSPELALKVSSRFTTSLGASFNHNRNDIQYYDTFTDASGVEHYTFAHLDQRTFSLTWRLGYTFTPTTSLQIYASPFVSKGTYTDVREVAAARASEYDARYRPYGDPAVTSDPGGFNFQQFRSNVVFRWEYRPGSTLFLVWSQGREGSSDLEGTKSFRGDLGDLFGRRADDAFLVKVSYWLTP